MAVGIEICDAPGIDRRKASKVAASPRHRRYPMRLALHMGRRTTSIPAGSAQATRSATSRKRAVSGGGEQTSQA